MSEEVYRHERIGTSICLVGTAVSIVGSWVNSINLDHNLAIYVWAISNPLLMAWAYGFTKRWWNGGVSGMSLVVMYGYYIVTNIWAMIQIS
jgi:hypothetical protein